MPTTLPHLKNLKAKALNGVFSSKIETLVSLDFKSQAVLRVFAETKWQLVVGGFAFSEYCTALSNITLSSIACMSADKCGQDRVPSSGEAAVQMTKNN